MMKKFWMISAVLAGMFFVPSASALIDNGSMAEVFTLPGVPGISVMVESSVAGSPGDYLYTYRVTGIDDLKIISLSVPFLTHLAEPGEVYDFTPDPDNDLATLYWGAIGNPAVAAYALFIPQLLPNGITTEYQFKSIYAAQEVTGFVDEAQLGSLYGTLLAPVPEPMTLSLLALGGLMVRRRR